MPQKIKKVYLPAFQELWPPERTVQTAFLQRIRPDEQGGTIVILLVKWLEETVWRSPAEVG